MQTLKNGMGCQHNKIRTIKILQPNPQHMEIFSLSPEGVQEGFPIIPHTEAYRILGALITTGTSNPTLVKSLKVKTNKVVTTIMRKHINIKDLTPILQSAVFPSLAYPLQFAPNASYCSPPSQVNTDKSPNANVSQCSNL